MGCASWSVCSSPSSTKASGKDDGVRGWLSADDMERGGSVFDVIYPISLSFVAVHWPDMDDVGKEGYTMGAVKERQLEVESLPLDGD